MSVRPILVYGDPALEAENSPVETFDEELEKLIVDLFDTGWKAPGLGLAAPQIGVNLRLATIDLSVGKDPEAKIVLANPEIIRTQGKVSLEEGVFPSRSFYDHRAPSALVVRAQDEEVSGGKSRLRAFGPSRMPRGRSPRWSLLVHHLRGMKKRLFMRRVEKMRKLGVWQATA